MKMMVCAPAHNWCGGLHGTNNQPFRSPFRNNRKRFEVNLLSKCVVSLSFLHYKWTLIQSIYIHFTSHRVVHFIYVHNLNICSEQIRKMKKRKENVTKSKRGSMASAGAEFWFRVVCIFMLRV